MLRIGRGGSIVEIMVDGLDQVSVEIGDRGQGLDDRVQEAEVRAGIVGKSRIRGSRGFLQWSTYCRSLPITPASIDD